MDHGRAALLDPAHAAARPTPAASAPTWVGVGVPPQPPTGPDIMSTEPAPQRHASPVRPTASAPAARFGPRNILLGAGSVLAALGVTTAILLSGPSEPVGLAGDSVAPPVAATAAQGIAEATPCHGGARTFVGGVTITRPGSVAAPVAGVEVRTSIKC